MDPAPGRRPRPMLLALFAGLETGMLAGAVVLAWFLLQSSWSGERWWGKLNLLASAFYGERALHKGLGQATLAGSALHFCVSGGAGLLFGLALEPFRPRLFRVVLLGLLAGLGAYYLAAEFAWKRLIPLLPLYAEPSTLLTGHLLFGLCLGLYPRLRANLEWSEPAAEARSEDLD